MATAPPIPFGVSDVTGVGEEAWSWAATSSGEVGACHITGLLTWATGSGEVAAAAAGGPRGPLFHTMAAAPNNPVATAFG